MPAAEWWLRRIRFLDFEVFLLGTAINSSGLLGSATARTLVQISAALGTEPSAVFAAERIARESQHQFFPDGGRDVDVGVRVRERVHTRVVLEIGIGREHRIDRRLDRDFEFLEAPAAVHSSPPRKPSSPDVITAPGDLQRARHFERPRQRHLEPVKQGIGRRNCPNGLDRPSSDFPNINPEHSP